MTTLDLIIVAALAVGMARGVWTGVIRQVTGLIGLLLAFVLAVRLMTPVGALVADSIGVSPRVAPIVGFVLVFLVVQIAVVAIARATERLVGVLRLGFVNRLAGGAFGAFKAALLLSVLFLVLAPLSLPDGEARASSVLYEPVAGVLPTAWDTVADHWPRVQHLAERFGELPLLEDLDDSAQ